MSAEAEQPQSPGVAESNLTVTLTYAEWCLIMGCVGTQPLRDVLPVFNRLMTQLGPQADAQQLQAVMALTPPGSEARN